jgi:hypothetical protein
VLHRRGDGAGFYQGDPLGSSHGRKRNSYHLIESLGGQIAAEILKSYPVGEVTVRVRKETPLLDGIVDYVGVEVTRRRRGFKPSGKGSR